MLTRYHSDFYHQDRHSSFCFDNEGQLRIPYFEFRFQLQDDFQLHSRIRFTLDLGLAARFNSLLVPIFTFDSEIILMENLIGKSEFTFLTCAKFHVDGLLPERYNLFSALFQYSRS